MTKEYGGGWSEPEGVEAGPAGELEWLTSLMHVGIEPDVVFMGFFVIPTILVVLLLICECVGRIFPSSDAARLRERMFRAYRSAVEPSAGDILRDRLNSDS